MVCLLEEAGEEDFCPMVHSAIRGHGHNSEIEGFQKSIRELMDKRFIDIATDRDTTSLKFIPLPIPQGRILLQDLASCTQWFAKDNLWKWTSKNPRCNILLTDSGLNLTRQILLED